MSKAYVFLADGFEEIEGLTVVDLFRRAGIDTVTVSIKNTLDITGSHGIALKTDTVFTACDFEDADLLVLPGGMPGTKYLREYAPLKELLIKKYDQGVHLAAICAAPSVLAVCGLLNQKKVTSYPTCLDPYSGFEYSEDEVVTDGNITTSRGMGTAIPFALELIRILISGEKAKQLADSIIYRK